MFLPGNTRTRETSPPASNSKPARDDSSPVSKIVKLISALVSHVGCAEDMMSVSLWDSKYSDGTEDVLGLNWFLNPQSSCSARPCSLDSGACGLIRIPIHPDAEISDRREGSLRWDQPLEQEDITQRASENQESCSDSSRRCSEHRHDEQSNK